MNATTILARIELIALAFDDMSAKDAHVTATWLVLGPFAQA